MLGQYVTSEEGPFTMSMLETLYAQEKTKRILKRAAIVGITTDEVQCLINR